MEARLAVYVPRPGTGARTLIVPGSGVVGPVEPDAAGRLSIDFEGNLFAAINIVTFADRVLHAAGRQLSQYPTIARASVSAAELIRVGFWDPNEGVVVLEPPVSNAGVLSLWLGAESLDPAELQATGAHYEQRRAVREALNSGDPARVASAREYARQRDIDVS